MAYEIDFLPVGEGERSGDAIALRFGTLANSNEQTVVVLDGGTKESGAALVEHIGRYYGTDRVDAVICTHSDADHASGLTEVIENLDVKRLCMHLPWNHAGDLENQLKRAAVGDSVRQHFRKSLESAHDLENLARKRGIPIFELFSDTSKPNGAFSVLGPSKAFYESLLASFRCAEELDLRESFLAKALAAVAKTTDKALNWIAETWDEEALVEPDDDACSAENNSSLVLLFTHEGNSFLFTSDAGVLALGHAADYAERIGIDLRGVGGIQVPHHGSKRNVGPDILDRIVGPRLLSTQRPAAAKNAIVSASIGAPKHPSKRVVNAFKRRGADVSATQGKPLCKHSADVTPRPGWRTADVLPFYEQFEE